MQNVKMVVTGPFNSGKTEFIHTVSEIDVVSTEKKITAIDEKNHQGYHHGGHGFRSHHGG